MNRSNPVVFSCRPQSFPSLMFNLHNWQITFSNNVLVQYRPSILVSRKSRTIVFSVYNDSEIRCFPGRIQLPSVTDEWKISGERVYDPLPKILTLTGALEWDSITANSPSRLCHNYGCLMFNKYHYCPDVVSFPVDNVLQNSHLHSKQVLFDLNLDSLYNPFLKGGCNEFR